MEATKKTTKKNKTKKMPLWKVILLNDNINKATDITNRVMEITALNKEEAIIKTVEAHTTGRALLVICHFEKAELYKEQFHSLLPHPIGIELEPC